MASVTKGKDAKAYTKQHRTANIQPRIQRSGEGTRHRGTVLLTGATGTMGLPTLRRLLRHPDLFNVRVLSRTEPHDLRILKEFAGADNFSVAWGDLRDRQAVARAVRGCTLVLHVGALVSPRADADPKLAMAVNAGGTFNLVEAVRENLRTGAVPRCGFVNIGTIAETGDRHPPIHWGRVGDPIKPSMFDYYAVSKSRAEREVIESGLPDWVSLRQTGILSTEMCQVRDPIILHNPFDNVLEYVSDRDSAILLENLAVADATGELPPEFWRHIYNIGGGPSCRASTVQLYGGAFARLGVPIGRVFDPRLQATRNFHGQYYLDSDCLESFLGFRHDSIDYFYQCFERVFAPAVGLRRVLGPAGSGLIGLGSRALFRHLAASPRGTLRFLRRDMRPQIDAYWGSREAWSRLPQRYEDLRHFADWDHVVPIDHGWDEDHPDRLDLAGMRRAAAFRGGKCVSESMPTAPACWDVPLDFVCAFGHRFSMTPRCVLEGGFWCPVCDAKSWNYGVRARYDPFFAQVWNPLHSPDELREYPKKGFSGVR